MLPKLLRRSGCGCRMPHRWIAARRLAAKSARFPQLQQVLEEGKVNDISFDDHGRTIVRMAGSSNSEGGISSSSRLGLRLAHYILPKNYPHSVSEGYAPYVQRQMVSAFLSSAGGVMSMQAMLSAVGVGSGALPMAATLSWVLKDGLGQLGSIFFANFVNNRFDSEPKRWRLLAALSLELACFAEMLTAVFPAYFLPIAALANTGKNIAFLASSASRAALHVSLAKAHNLADITAKAGSQNILSSMCGTGLGIALTYGIGVLGGQLVEQMATFAALSSASLWFNYQSLQHVSLRTLNFSRLDMILSHSIRMFPDPGRARKLWPVLSPTEVRDREVMLASQDSWLPPLTVGADFHTVFADYEEYQQVARLLSEERYLVYVPNPANQTVHILLRQEAGQRDLLRAMCHAHCLRQLLHGEKVNPGSTADLLGKDTERMSRLAGYDEANPSEGYHSVAYSYSWLLEESENCDANRKTVTILDGMIDLLLASPWQVTTGLLESRHARVVESVPQQRQP